MMMWGDIINRHPEITSNLPDDITLLEWGYEGNHPFEERCKRFQSSGLDYLVCPGTSSWMTLAGRTDNMKANITKAIENGIEYGSKGMLLTDWGDLGHWQYLPVSYAGYSYGAALSWNFESRDRINLEKYLNLFVFKDEENIMGRFVQDMGRYNRFEEFYPPNMTQVFIGYQFGLQDKVLVDAAFEGVINSLTDLVPDPGMIEEAELFRDEFLNTIRMIRLGADLKYYIQSEQTMSPEERISFLEQMSDRCWEVLAEVVISIHIY